MAAAVGAFGRSPVVRLLPIARPDDQTLETVGSPGRTSNEAATRTTEPVRSKSLLLFCYLEEDLLSDEHTNRLPLLLAGLSHRRL